MITRTCAACGRSKTIEGVWYLTPGRRGAAGGAFVCETCFSAARVRRDDLRLEARGHLDPGSARGLLR